VLRARDVKEDEPVDDDTSGRDDGRDRVEGTRRELRTPRAAGVAGLLFAGFFISALLVARGPGGDPASTFARWYSGGSLTAIVVVGLYAIPLAGIAFLWFIGVVRERIGEKEDRLFSTVFLGSGLLFVAMLFSAAASATGLAIGMDAASPPPSASALHIAQALTYAYLYVYAARAAGVFMIVTSSITWRTRTVPRWICIIGYLVALALLFSVRDFQLIIMLFPLWVALVSVFILVAPARSGARAEASS
jgi:hypothetical protein